MIATLAALSLIAVQSSTPAAATSSIDVASLIGKWVCHGHFVKSGRPLDATVTIVQSEIANTLLVEHRDVPPGTYHSSEIWSLTPQGMRAAVVDATGMRWFEGRADARNLVFTRDTDGTPLEQFAYRPSSGGLTIDWSYRNANGALSLGDTLSCKR